MDFHSFAEVPGAVEVLDDVNDDDDREYFKTISVQRLKTGSVMWSFQLTAERKAISLALISHVLNPEILLQARAEKFRSCKYLDARISAARNMRLPHCIARHDCESTVCSIVKSCLGTNDCINTK